MRISRHQRHHPRRPAGPALDLHRQRDEYGTPGRQCIEVLDVFEAGGLTLSMSSVQQLVDAMASWSATPGATDADRLDALQQQDSTLHAALAAWAAPAA